MKKKIIFLLVIIVLLITGCGKNDENKVLKKVKNNIDKYDKYEVKADLELISNDESYNYSVVVDNYKDKYYKVSLVNKASSKEQIILKNSDAVYVITPTLNKSFKFQSDWPNNNSQIYLPESIYSDISADDKRKFEYSNNEYTFISTVNYPNNNSLVKQKVIIDKDYNIKQVEILNNNDIAMMTIVFKKMKSKNLEEEDFSLDTFIDIEDEEEQNTKDENKNEPETKEETTPDEERTTEDDKQTSSLDDIIYPLYLPTNTKLSDEQTINTEKGERAILTFAGDKSFILVEETSKKEKEFTIVPTSGDPYLFMDAVGTISDNSISWTSNNVDYYITSTVMSKKELLEVAQSISIVPNTK